MFPETPSLGTVESFDGHLWIQEQPTGGAIAISLSETGAITVETPTTTTPTMTAPTLSHREAVRFVREHLDRERLETAVSDPTAITLVGIASWENGVAYDWEQLPPFVGIDVYRGDEDRYLPPDVATTVFERLGVPPAPAIHKEQPAKRFDWRKYEQPAGLPESVWASERAAAVLVRDKTGTRGIARRDRSDDRNPLTVEECLRQCVSEEQIEQTVAAVRAAGTTPTVEAVRERLLGILARKERTRLYTGAEPAIDLDRLRAELGELIQRQLN